MITCGSRPIRRASVRSRLLTRSPASAARSPVRRSTRRPRCTRKRRARQHARHRRRHHVGDAHRRAEHTGAIEHARRDDLDQRRRLIVVHEPEMAEEHRQREVGAAGMIDADEGAVRDDVVGLLAAIIRVRAPTNVAEQARGMAQALLLGVSSRPDEAIKRSVQSISSSPCAGERERRMLRSRAAAISGSCFFSARVEQVVEQTFTHAERGEDDVLRPCHAHDVFEHKRAIGEQRAPGIGDDFDARQHLGVHAMHEPRELERLACRDGVAVRHMQRITRLPHVQAGKRAPRSADGIEGAAAAAAQGVSTATARFCTIRSAFLIDFADASCSASPPSGSVTPRVSRAPCTSTSSSEPPPRSPTMPSGPMKPGDDAKRGKLCFAPAGENLDLPPADALRLGDESGPVARIAARRGRQHPRPLDLEHVAERTVAAQRRERLEHRVACEQTRSNAPRARGRRASFR